jgi:hypothetical protein
MRIGDPRIFPQITFPVNPSVPGFGQNQVSISFTESAAEVLTAILEQLAEYPAPRNAALLLSRDHGINRSQLLHYLEQLLTRPDHDAWASLLQCLNLGEDAKPKTPIQSLFVQIPPNPSINLEVFFRDAVQWDSPDTSLLLSQDEIVPDSFSAFAGRVSDRMAEQSLGMVILENISQRIDTLNDPKKLQEERNTLRILSEALSSSGILTVLYADESHLVQSAQMHGKQDSYLNYSWMEFSDPSPFMLPESQAGREDRFNERLQLVIYDWIQSEIPRWQPDRGPRYSRDSQALEATIPESDEAPAGLVYFKTIFDPHWSNEDLAELQDNASWILMILSPCERFADFESRLSEICSRLPMMIIWRPEAPSRVEMERLHKLVRETSWQAMEDPASSEETRKTIYAILSDLYIRRGRVMESSGSHSICSRIGTQTIGQYLSAWLNRVCLCTETSLSRNRSVSATENTADAAIDWALLLTGRDEFHSRQTDTIKNMVMEWWETSAEHLLKKLPEIPETFRTIRFWKKIKRVEDPLLALKPIIGSLQSGSFTLFEAMGHVRRNFSGDKERLRQWKKQMGNIESFLLWLPAFMNARDYVTAALPIDALNLEQSRNSLLRTIEDSARFLEAKARSAFETQFLEFKKNYVNTYCRHHDKSLHLGDDLDNPEAKIDPAMLRNLELLSELTYADKRYINHIKILAKWIQRHRCYLPVGQILEHYPRCYCNFNPHSHQQPADLPQQIHRICQEGIDFFRQVLRRCSHLIAMEIESQQIEEGIRIQIASALSETPMAVLKPECIHALNDIIAMHPNRFRTEIRNAVKQSRLNHP